MPALTGAGGLRTTLSSGQKALAANAAEARRQSAPRQRDCATTTAMLSKPHVSLREVRGDGEAENGEGEHTQGA